MARFLIFKTIVSEPGVSGQVAAADVEPRQNGDSARRVSTADSWEPDAIRLCCQ
jgi:hypothetical protein